MMRLPNPAELRKKQSRSRYRNSATSQQSSRFCTQAYRRKRWTDQNSLPINGPQPIDQLQGEASACQGELGPCSSGFHETISGPDEKLRKRCRV